MRRRYKLLLLALLVLVLAFLGLEALRSSARGMLASGLSAFFQRPVRIGGLTVHAFPLSVEVRDLRVAGRDPAAAPFLEVARAIVVPRILPSFENRLVFSELRLEGPKVRIHAYPQGGDDIPRFGSAPGRGREVRFDRLIVQGGEVEIDHARVPVDVDLPDFQGRLDVRSDLALAGRLTFGPGTLQFADAPPLEVQCEIALVLAGRRLTLESGRIRAPHIDLEAKGELRFGSPLRGEIHVVGPVDIGVVDRHIVRTGLGLEGEARFDAELTLEGSKVAIHGRAEGRDGRFDDLPIDRYAANLRWDGDGLHLSELEAEALGGHAALEAFVQAGPARAARVRVVGRLDGLDAERVIGAVFDWGTPGVGSSAFGDVDLSWPRGRPRELSGRMAIDLVPRADGRTPLGGRFEWAAETGRMTVTGADLKTPMLHARLEGQVEADDRADLRLDADSSDIAAADELVLRLRRALGNADAEATGLTGTATFRGRYAGSLKAPIFEGRLAGQDVGWRGVRWGEANGVGSVSGEALLAHSLVLRRGTSEIWIDGRFETGDLGVRDAAFGQLRLKDWPAEDIATAFAWALPLEGPLSGEIALRGRRSAPLGDARLSARQGRFSGVSFTGAEVALRWADGATRIESGRAGVGGGDVAFRGSLTDDGFYDGAAEATGIEISGIWPLLPGRLSGRMSGELTFQGPLARPRLRARLSSPRLFVGDEGLGAIEATLQGSGDGRVTVAATCRSGRVDLALDGTLGAAFPFDSTVRMRAQETSLDPFFRTAFPALPTALGLVATGSLEVEGPLAKPVALIASGQVDQLEVRVSDYPAFAPAPLRFRVDAGFVTVDPFTLAAEGTDLRLAGRADLIGDGPLDLSLRGDADLRGLSVLMRPLRGTGTARLALAVTGTRKEPHAEGTLKLEGAGLRLRGFPHGLEETSGIVRFTEAGAALEEFHGRLAGGEVVLEGQAALARGEITSFDLRPRGQGLSLRWPEGLRSLVDVDLRFFGDPARRFVTGRVDVRQAVYTRRHDVASEILAVRAVERRSESEGTGANLDIRIVAPGTLRVDNNLASLTGRADLALRGTIATPVLLGRAEVDRGRIYFQGRTYVIRHGALDFANPTELDPLFDIEAETRLQSYRVTLRLNGTLDRVTSTLTSDPPLSALQILNLLAGADERTVASMTAAQSNEAQLAATGAATLAAGKLAEEMGLERGAERLLGLDRFSIDPSLLRGNGQTPTARLTLGKRITSDVNVVYSQDLGGSGERWVAVEYILSDRFSLLLTRSDPDGFGFDVRLRRSR